MRWVINGFSLADAAPAESQDERSGSIDGGTMFLNEEKRTSTSQTGTPFNPPSQPSIGSDPIRRFWRFCQTYLSLQSNAPPPIPEMSTLAHYHKRQIFLLLLTPDLVCEDNGFSNDQTSYPFCPSIRVCNCLRSGQQEHLGVRQNDIASSSERGTFR
jgi:hypothetical protein